VNEDRLNPAKEKLIPCYVCGKVWTRKDADKWFYFFGLLVCKEHPGAQEWYDGTIKLSLEKLKLQLSQ